MANLNLTLKQHDRFWSRVLKSDGCWTWMGGRTIGHGYFSAGRRNLLHAHRVMFALEVGPIPVNATVLHSCGDLYCVNPSHLRLGDYGEHNPLSRLSERELFDRHVDKSAGPSACWPWTGAINRGTGYGVFQSKSTTIAHRFAYGQVPSGMVIDHLCRNKRCVNPLHLEAVTQRVNMLRGEAPAAKSVRHQLCQRGLHRLDIAGSRNSEGRCRECVNARMRAWNLTPAGQAANRRRKAQRKAVHP